MSQRRRIVRRPQSESHRFSGQLPDFLHPLLAARGISDDEAYDTSLAGLLAPNLKNIDLASTLLANAISSGQRLLIVGDFDADGATATALGMRVLRAMGSATVDYLVPNRFEYGYGLTPEIVQLARHRNPDLIITVDNGISSIEGVAAANAAGIPVLVTDHHLPGKTLPDAAAIVNPNLSDCPFPSGNLAGVGVMFYLLAATRTRLVGAGWFEARNIPAPRLADWLDLVALGTVADVVPLDRNNRILVEQGLKRMRAGKARPGILALLALAKRNPARLVAADLGFAIGPRLNAAGRLDDMGRGIECLLTDDDAEARRIAEELDSLNRERREIEGGIVEEARQIMAGLSLDERQLPAAISLYRQGWHQGVVGIVASRIKERFHRPTVVFADADEGSLKGSGRSINGVHLRDVLERISTENPGLIGKFGGHAMAAGLSIRPADFERFTVAFDAVVASWVSAEILEDCCVTDGPLPSGLLALETAEILRLAGPWGQHFPEPLFDDCFQVVQARWLQGKHLKLLLCRPGEVDTVWDAIAFNQEPEHWVSIEEQLLRVVYRLDVNEWKGRRSLQLMVDYLEAAEPDSGSDGFNHG